jgi:hypothetical protein
MDNIDITYRFQFDDGLIKTYSLEIDEQSLLVHNIGDTKPAWTDLSYHKCKHCPLDEKEHENCPAATTLAGVADAFDQFASYNEVTLEVITKERSIKQETSVQAALSSLYGLLLATSGCPYTDYMKPMARFHVPLSGTEETLFRAAGMYLLARYFNKADDDTSEFDLDGLKKIYDNLTLVNHGLVARVRSTHKSDSSTNAIVILDMKASYVPFVLKDQLDSIKHLFDAYINS